MRKFVLILLMFVCCVSVNAQYVGNRFFDNWSVGLNGGVTTNFHDWDTPNGGIAGITLNKAITPIVGFEFASQVGFNNNANWNVFHSYNIVDNSITTAGCTFNLTNAIFGYKEYPRIFEVSAKAGVGYMRAFYNGDDNNSTVGKVGLDFNFNLDKSRSWSINVSPVIFFKGDNGDAWCDNGICSKYTHNAVGQITAGIVYHFKSSNGKKYFTKVNPVIVTNTVEKEVVVTKETVKTVEVVKPIENTYIITFAQNSFVLTDKAKATLSKIGNKKVNIAATASPEGTKSYNQKLSENRANAVKEYLEGIGTTVASSVGMGVEDPESNRIAVITVE